MTGHSKDAAKKVGCGEVIALSLDRQAVDGDTVCRHWVLDPAPENPDDGTPYFVVRESGFGAGWSAGSVIPFSTETQKDNRNG